jgi:hypothetical protein
LECLEKEPRLLRKVAAMVEKRTGKKAHVETFRRILKKLGKIWKRQRKIPKGQPDPEAYEQTQAVTVQTPPSPALDPPWDAGVASSPIIRSAQVSDGAVSSFSADDYTPRVLQSA